MFDMRENLQQSEIPLEAQPPELVVGMQQWLIELKNIIKKHIKKHNIKKQTKNI